MKKGKVSLITPVCNTPLEYFHRALLSVRDQSCDCDDFEWVVVLHNCDKTYEDQIRELLNERQDTTVTELHNELHSPSGPRNEGLLKACGEYLMFLDADDELDRDAVKTALDCIKKTGADLVFLGADTVADDEDCIKIEKPSVFEYTFDRILLKKSDPQIPLLLIGGGESVWGKAYRKKFLDEKGIRFQDETELGEDIVFNAACLGNAASVYKNTAAGAYIYHQHGSSQLQDRIYRSGRASFYIDSYIRAVLMTGKNTGMDFNLFAWYEIATSGIGCLYQKGLNREQRRANYDLLVRLSDCLRPIEKIQGTDENEIARIRKTVKDAVPSVRVL